MAIKKPRTLKQIMKQIDIDQQRIERQLVQLDTGLKKSAPLFRKIRRLVRKMEEKAVSL